MQSHRLIAVRASLSQAEWIADTATGWLTQTPSLVNFLITGVSRGPSRPTAAQAHWPTKMLNLFRFYCLDLSQSVPLRLFSQIGLGFFAGKTRGSLQAQSGLGHISALCDRSSTPYRRDREHIRWICF